jgi:hypothetical protein
VRQESRRPRKEHGQGAEHEARVTLFAAELAEFHAPVQRAEEREDDGAVSDLDLFERVQRREDVRVLHAEDRAVAWALVSCPGLSRERRRTLLELACFAREENGAGGGTDVRNGAEQTFQSA